MHLLTANKTRIPLGLSLIAAISYLILPFEAGSLAIIIQKSLACFLLAVTVAMTGFTGQTKKTLLLALLASTAGDAFLAIRTGDYFVHGLGSFLIAHILYIRVFTRNLQFSGADHRMLREMLSGLLILFAGIMMYLLWDKLGAMRLPVVLYITVITAMGLFAIRSHFSLLWMAMGAGSFMISDSAIAVNKFLSPFDASGPFIWITYMLAQYTLTFAILGGTVQKKADD